MMQFCADRKRKLLGETLIDNRAAASTIVAMTTPLCTAEQRDAIRQAALARVHYIRWIADKLLATEDRLIRIEAAKLLRELTEAQ
jgi:hypothetical protein